MPFQHVLSKSRFKMAAFRVGQTKRGRWELCNGTHVTEGRGVQWGGWFPCVSSDPPLQWGAICPCCIERRHSVVTVACSSSPTSYSSALSQWWNNFTKSPGAGRGQGPPPQHALARAHSLSHFCLSCALAVSLVLSLSLLF